MGLDDVRRCAIIEIVKKDALLRDALELPPGERAELARDLIRSLDGPPDPDSETAWAADIERRARELADGTAEAVDWESCREEIARRLRERRS